MRVSREQAMAAYIPGLYPVALSWSRNTRVPAMPPMPPKPTSKAEQKARFHCPRMLFAWYAMMAGTLELAPAVTRKTPKYRTADFW